MYDYLYLAGANNALYKYNNIAKGIMLHLLDNHEAILMIATKMETCMGIVLTILLAWPYGRIFVVYRLSFMPCTTLPLIELSWIPGHIATKSGNQYNWDIIVTEFRNYPGTYI